MFGARLKKKDQTWVFKFESKETVQVKAVPPNLKAWLAGQFGVAETCIKDSDGFTVVLNDSGGVVGSFPPGIYQIQASQSGPVTSLNLERVYQALASLHTGQGSSDFTHSDRSLNGPIVYSISQTADNIFVIAINSPIADSDCKRHFAPKHIGQDITTTRYLDMLSKYIPYQTLVAMLHPEKARSGPPPVIIFCGFFLGGSVASLAALQMSSILNKSRLQGQVQCVTFNSPGCVFAPVMISDEDVAHHMNIFSADALGPALLNIFLTGHVKASEEDNRDLAPSVTETTFRTLLEAPKDRATFEDTLMMANKLAEYISQPESVYRFEHVGKCWSILARSIKLLTKQDISALFRPKAGSSHERLNFQTIPKVPVANVAFQPQSTKPKPFKVLQPLITQVNVLDAGDYQTFEIHGQGLECALSRHFIASAADSALQFTGLVSPLEPTVEIRIEKQAPATVTISVAACKFSTDTSVSIKTDFGTSWSRKIDNVTAVKPANVADLSHSSFDAGFLQSAFLRGMVELSQSKEPTTTPGEIPIFGLLCDLENEFFYKEFETEFEKEFEFSQTIASTTKGLMAKDLRANQFPSLIDQTSKGIKHIVARLEGDSLKIEIEGKATKVLLGSRILYGSLLVIGVGAMIPGFLIAAPFAFAAFATRGASDFSIRPLGGAAPTMLGEITMAPGAIVAIAADALRDRAERALRDPTTSRYIELLKFLIDVVEGRPQVRLDEVPTLETVLLDSVRSRSASKELALEAANPKEIADFLTYNDKEMETSNKQHQVEQQLLQLQKPQDSNRNRDSIKVAADTGSPLQVVQENRGARSLCSGDEGDRDDSTVEDPAIAKPYSIIYAAASNESKKQIVSWLTIAGRIAAIRTHLRKYHSIGFIGVHNAGKSTLIKNIFGFETNPSGTTRTEEMSIYPCPGWSRHENDPFVEIIDFPGSTDQRAFVANMAAKLSPVVSVFVIVISAQHCAEPEHKIINLVKNTGKPFILLMNRKDSWRNPKEGEAYRKTVLVQCKLKNDQVFLTDAEDEADIEKIRSVLYLTLTPSVSTSREKESLALSLLHQKQLRELDALKETHSELMIREGVEALMTNPSYPVCKPNLSLWFQTISDSQYLAKADADPVLRECKESLEPLDIKTPTMIYLTTSGDHHRCAPEIAQAFRTMQRNLTTKFPKDSVNSAMVQTAKLASFDIKTCRDLLNKQEPDRVRDLLNKQELDRVRVHRRVSFTELSRLGSFRPAPLHGEEKYPDLRPEHSILERRNILFNGLVPLWKGAAKVFVNPSTPLQDFTSRVGAMENPRRRLITTIVGDQATDARCATRRMFEMCADELKAGKFPGWSFKIESNLVYCDPTASMELGKNYFFLGRLIALAILHECLLPARFPEAVFKVILGEYLTFADLQAIDPDMGVEMRKLWLCRETELIQRDHRFQTSFDRAEHANQFIQSHLGNNAPLKFLALGFEEVIPRARLTLFSSAMLRQLVCGTDHIEVRNLIDHIVYQVPGCVKGWIIEFLLSLNAEQIPLFLSFVTSSSSLPRGGFMSLPSPITIIEMNTLGADSFPRSRPCDCTLDLPSYPTYEVFAQKLLYTITNSSVRAFESDGTNSSDTDLQSFPKVL